LSRKNVSLSPQIEARASELIQARAFQGMSELIAALIREEYERRHPPTVPDPAELAAKHKAQSQRNLAHLKSKHQQHKLAQ
jgi:Arc/MetJ-type ribon-helix-helix transcriptional regulator